MDRALGRTDRDLSTNGTVFYEGDTIYSYGYHFPMAIIMRDEHDQPSWVLVNGDRYSVTTSGHQGQMRSVIESTHLDAMIVPFSALNAAGIRGDFAFRQIEPLEVRPDRNEVIPRSRTETPEGEMVRPWDFEAKGYGEPDPRRRYERKGKRGHILEQQGGLWHWEEHRHWLGDSLFIAKVDGRRRRFLSSFDYQEAQPLYFLCELPRTSKATTVEQAYEDLKPESVKEAESAGMEVERQGDIFAIPTSLTTKQVRMLTPHRKGRIVKRPKRGLLETNHTASEVMYATYGRVYARGLLYHAPGEHRPPDHARRKLGDGKTWHLLTKNTVPRAQANPRTREFA